MLLTETVLWRRNMGLSLQGGLKDLNASLGTYVQHLGIAGI